MSRSPVVRTVTTASSIGGFVLSLKVRSRVSSCCFVVSSMTPAKSLTIPVGAGNGDTFCDHSACCASAHRLAKDMSRGARRITSFGLKTFITIRFSIVWQIRREYESGNELFSVTLRLGFAGDIDDGGPENPDRPSG